MSGCSYNNRIGDGSLDGGVVFERKILIFLLVRIVVDGSHDVVGRSVAMGVQERVALILSRVLTRLFVSVLLWGVVALIVVDRRNIGIPVILFFLFVRLFVRVIVDWSVIDGRGVVYGCSIMHGFMIHGRVENVIQSLLVGGEGIAGCADLEADHASCENSACEVHSGCGMNLYDYVFFIIII